MQVDKDQFDALLHRMVQSPPEAARTIKGEGKAGRIIPAPKPETQPSEPRKA